MKAANIMDRSFLIRKCAIEEIDAAVHIGEIGWLHEAESKGEGDNGYAEFYKTIDTLLIGKRTYDQVSSIQS